MSRPAHQWDTTELKKHMKIEEESVLRNTSNLPVIVDNYECERYVEGVVQFNLMNVGNTKYLEQHRVLEKLNLQAHQHALSNSDEYVLEAFLTFDKLATLIHDLILIEAYKDRIFPAIIDKIINKNAMRMYFILYHEATVINLLEVFLYHKHICEGAGEKMLELVDYVARKLVYLNDPNNAVKFDTNHSMKAQMKHGDAKELAAQLESRSPRQDVQTQFDDIEFRVCISCVAIARFLCEHCDALPLSVISRITDTHDLLMLLIPLIENPPWTRRSSGKWEKLVDFQWQEVLPIDLLKVTKLEGQCWIGLYYLLSRKAFQERYHLNAFRKGMLLRVRKYINEIMLDQLPFLADIQRYMDELAMSNVPEPHTVIGGSSSVFLFQQVALTRESFLKADVQEVIDYQLSHVFTMTDKTDKDLLAMADLYSDDATEGVVNSAYDDQGGDR